MRKALLAFCIAALTWYGIATPAGAQSDPGLKGCRLLATAFKDASDTQRTADANAGAAYLERVKGHKLQALLAQFDVENGHAAAPVIKWCRAHYPKDRGLRTMTFVAAPTTTTTRTTHHQGACSSHGGVGEFYK